MLIVRATAQFDIADRRLSVQGKRVHVMKLEESGLVAPTLRPDEGTSPAITPTFTDRIAEGGRSPSEPAVAGAQGDSRPTESHWESVIDRATD